MKRLILRGMLASVLKGVTFQNGEKDFFTEPFAELSPNIKRQYEILVANLKGLYPQQSLPFPDRDDTPSDPDQS